MPRAIGIDLGTTNSLVAARRRAEPSAQSSPADEGRPLLAVGGLLRAGRARSRWAPPRSAARRSGRVDTVLSVKRFMGRGPGDVRPEDRGIYRFDESGAVVKLAVAGGARAVTPVEVSAEILRVLKRRAAEALGGPPGRAASSRCPPTSTTRSARRRRTPAGSPASTCCGSSTSRPRRRSPTASTSGREGVFAVYDLGGGTFDVSILRLERRRLRGALDRRRHPPRRRRLRSRSSRAGSSTTAARPRRRTPSPAVLRGAVAAAQRIRETLTDEAVVEAEVELPEGLRLRGAAHARGARGAHPAGRGADHRPLPRGAPRRERRAGGRRRARGRRDAHAARAAPRARSSSARSRSPISTPTPSSRSARRCRRTLLDQRRPRGRAPPRRHPPLARRGDDGRRGREDHPAELDHPGERDPAVHDLRGRPDRDGRSTWCRASASSRATAAPSRASRSSGIPPMPAGIARVEITYAVDADGILQVSARELTTGIEQEIQVKPTYGLAEEEIEKMLVESIEHAEEDVTERFVREWRVEGDRILASLETAFALDGELLAPDERATIEERMRGLREAMAGTDYLAVKAWIESVDGATKQFAERRMNKHVAQAMAGHRVEEFAERVAENPRTTGSKQEDLEDQTGRASACPRSPSSRTARRARSRAARRSSTPPTTPAWTCRTTAAASAPCTTCHVWVERGLESLSELERPRGRQAERGRRARAELAARLPGQGRRRGRAWSGSRATASRRDRRSRHEVDGRPRHRDRARGAPPGREAALRPLHRPAPLGARAARASRTIPRSRTRRSSRRSRWRGSTRSRTRAEPTWPGRVARHTMASASGHDDRAAQACCRTSSSGGRSCPAQPPACAAQRPRASP